MLSRYPSVELLLKSKIDCEKKQTVIFYFLF